MRIKKICTVLRYDLEKWCSSAIKLRSRRCEPVGLLSDDVD